MDIDDCSTVGTAARKGDTLLGNHRPVAKFAMVCDRAVFGNLCNDESESCIGLLEGDIECSGKVVCRESRQIWGEFQFELLASTLEGAIPLASGGERHIDLAVCTGGCHHAVVVL